MRTTSRSRPRFRLLALIRATGVVLVCSLLSLVALLRATQARAGDVLVQLGQQLMRLPEAHHSGVRQLWINGMSLMTQSGSSDRHPIEVAEQFRAECKKRGAIQISDRERAQAGKLNEATWFRSVLDGVIVEHSEAGTAVVCIDTLGKPWDPLSIAAAGQRFVETGDLLELGQLRYAWVRPGHRSGSVFLTFWTEGSTRLLEQFPRDHDAPGVDFPQVRRVPGSQRFLSARLSDSVMVLYSHRQGSLRELTDEYRAALKEGGYRILDTYTHDDKHANFAFAKGDAQVMLSAVSTHGKTLITLLSQP